MGRFCHSFMPSITSSVIVETLCRHVGVLDLGQVSLHLAGGQALGRQRDHQLVHAPKPPLPLRDDLRFEGGVPVARHVDLDRPDPGQPRLEAVPVAEFRRRGRSRRGGLSRGGR